MFHEIRYRQFGRFGIPHLLANGLPAAAIQDQFQGQWSRDCGNGQTCHLNVLGTKSRNNAEITFSIEGDGRPCSWSVSSVYDKSLGGPVARDPYGNYYFYLTVQEDGRLYSSGTIMSKCGAQPLDQYFDRDPVLGASSNDALPSTVGTRYAQDIVNNREIFDHNGSAMVVDPGDGTIIYRDPKRSIAKTVPPGALLFKVYAPWDPYDDQAVVQGTAFVFKQGCKPAPYKVSGRQQGWHTLVLKGVAPVLQKNGCDVVGFEMNGNSVLKFVSWGD